MTHRITLTDEQQRYANDLGELLDFSHQQLATTKIKLSEIRTRKRVLLAMLVAAHNYSESIFMLLREARTHACHPLLRSLLELYINSRYIFTSRSFKRLAGLALKGEKGLRGRFEQMRKYRADHPDLDTTQESVPDNKLDEAIVNIKKLIKAIERRYAGTREAGNLRQRAKAVDDYNIAKAGKIESPLEWHYLALYWFFSGFSHLSLRELDQFFKTTDKGIELMLSGDPDSVIRICVSTYAWYLGILNLFSHQFGVPSRKDIKPYLEKLKSYAKESPQVR